MATFTITAVGTGLNQPPGGAQAPPRALFIDDGGERVTVYEERYPRGLRFSLLHNGIVVMDQTFDTWGNAGQSSALARELAQMGPDGVGVLTSWDAWETSLNDELGQTFSTLGLKRAFEASQTRSGIRRPYAAVFSLSKAFENIQSAAPSAPPAVVEVKAAWSDGGRLLRMYSGVDPLVVKGAIAAGVVGAGLLLVSRR